MTQPVVAGIEELLSQAKRLGLVPSYRLGTVFGTTIGANAMVVLDNDAEPSRCYNFAGSLVAGDRVLTVAVKPQGVYVISVATPVRRSYAVTFMDGAACDSLLALTTTPTDISGCVLNVTTLMPDAKWHVVAFFDAQLLAANNNTPRGILQVAGVDEGSMALYSANFASSNNRATVGQTWEGTLPTPGTYEFRLQGDVTAGSLQWRFNAVHTKLNLTVYE